MNGLCMKDFDTPEVVQEAVERLIKQSEVDFKYTCLRKEAENDPEKRWTRYYHKKSRGKRSEVQNLHIDATTLHKNDVKGKALKDAITLATQPNIKIENEEWAKTKTVLINLNKAKNALLGDLSAGQDLLLKLENKAELKVHFDRATLSMKTMSDYCIELRKFLISTESMDGSSPTEKCLDTKKAA